MSTPTRKPGATRTTPGTSSSRRQKLLTVEITPDDLGIRRYLDYVFELPAAERDDPRWVDPQWLRGFGHGLDVAAGLCDKRFVELGFGGEESDVVGHVLFISDGARYAADLLDEAEEVWLQVAL